MKRTIVITAILVASCGSESSPHEWSSFTEPRPIGGRPHTWAAVSLEGDTRLLPASLMVVCKGATLIVAYSPSDTIRKEFGDPDLRFFFNEPADFVVRFDSVSSSLQSWGPSDDAVAFLSPEPMAFVQDLRTAVDRVEIRVADGQLDDVADGFPTAGFGDAASVLHCLT